MPTYTTTADLSALIQAANYAAVRTQLGLSTLATTTPGANVETMLSTFSSANIKSACTDETGSGALMFGTAPTMSDPTISGTITQTGTGGAGASIDYPDSGDTTITGSGGGKYIFNISGGLRFTGPVRDSAGSLGSS